MWRLKMGHADMADMNVYTAKKLNGMAQSLSSLARACAEDTAAGGALSRDDALAAMQMSAAMVCGDCSRCNLYSGSGKEDSYYLYYLLRAFEQKGHVDYEDMPRFFMETCRRREEYVAYLNRCLGKATMNLEWKNRFLESRDTVMVQFRELAVILEEFAHQIEQVTDVTASAQEDIRRFFRSRHIAVDKVLLLEYENHQREAYVTLHTTDGKCVTSREAAELLSKATDGQSWVPAKDTRALVTRRSATLRFTQEGTYRLAFGAAAAAKNMEPVSGDNYTFCDTLPGQRIISLSDGMGSGEQASQESRRVIELTQQLLEAGFSARAALKMVNTVLLLSGTEQHPATLDVCCVDLHNGVLDAMKLGAAATFVLGENGAEILEAGDVPVGVLGTVEPAILSKKLWDGNRIVMVSDGVLDACEGEDKERVLKEFLEDSEWRSPQEMAERILQFACSFGGSPRDDMTVLTAVIWKRT